MTVLTVGASGAGFQWSQTHRPLLGATRPLVYLAGPYTIPDPWENTKVAVECASRLLDSGKVTPLVPHLTYLWDQMKRRELTEWYAYDLELLTRCDAVFRLPGRSDGADAELRAARDLRLPIFFVEADVMEWASAWVSPSPEPPDSRSRQLHTRALPAIRSRRWLAPTNG